MRDGIDIARGFSPALQRGVVVGIALPLWSEGIARDAAVPAPAIQRLDDLLLGQRGIGREGVAAHPLPSVAESFIALEPVASVGNFLTQRLDFRRPSLPTP